MSGATLTSGILNVTLLVCLTRLLSKADFGVISYSYMLFGLISVVGALGLPSALLFYTSRLSPKAHRTLARHVTLLLLGLGCLFGTMLLFAGPYILSETQRQTVGHLLPILALALVGDLPGQTLPSYLLAMECYGLSAAATLGFSVMRFTGLIVPAMYGWGTEAMVWGLATATLLRGTLLFVYLWLGQPKSSLDDQSRMVEEDLTWSIKDLFAYGLPLSLSSIVGKVNVQADKYLIAAITSAEVYAIYHVGAIELPLVYGVAYSVTNALTPSLIHNYHQGKTDYFLRLWHTSVRKVASLIIPIALFLMCFAEEVIILAFSERYAQAALPFRVYLCLLPLRLCSYGSVVRATGLTKPVFTATLLSLCCNLILNYPLYQLLGLAGPALASVIAQGVAIFILLKVLTRQLSVSWSQIFPIKALLGTFSLASVTALIALAVSQVAPQTMLAPLFLGAILHCSLFLWLGSKIGILSEEDLDYVKGTLTLRRLRQSIKKRRSATR